MADHLRNELAEILSTTRRLHQCVMAERLTRLTVTPLAFHTNSSSIDINPDDGSVQSFGKIVYLTGSRMGEAESMHTIR